MRRPLLSLLLVAGLIAGLLSVACDKPPPVAPSGSTITLTVNPTRIEADGEASISALVREEDGQPVRQGTEILFSTTLGSIDSPVETDATGVAAATLKGDGRIGTATITVASGGAENVTAEAAVQIGSLAGDIVITPTPSLLPQEGGEVELVVVVFDTTGQPLKDAPVTFEAEIGILASRGSTVSTNTDGEAKDTLTVDAADIASLPDVLFLVSASTPADAGDDGGLLIFAEAEVDVLGVISFISLQATPSTVSDSGGTVSLLALVQDDVGVPVEGAPVNFGTDLGNLASGGGIVRTNAAGEAIDTLSVSAEDLTAIGTNTFSTTASTIGFDGGVLSDTFTVRVQSDVPFASFSWSAVGLVVTFTNTSTGQEPLNFEWSFGDNTTSNLRSPSHDYTPSGAGTYTVILVVTNEVGTDQAQDTFTLPVP